MPSVEELLSVAEADADTRSTMDSRIEIDADTRIIRMMPQDELFGVESDEKSERKYFKVPKIVGNGVDLSKLQLRINYQNASRIQSGKDMYIVTDATVYNDEWVYFSWELSRKVTQYKGNIYFIVCAVKSDSNGNITNEWNTTLAEGKVLEGLEVETSQEQQYQASDYLEQLKQQLLDYSKEIKDTFPSDYTQMQDDIGSLKEDIDMSKLINVHDFNTVNIFIKSDGTLLENNNGDAKSRIIPLYGVSRVYISTDSEHTVSYALLSAYDESSNSITYAIGENNRHDIDVNSYVYIKTNNANYLYVTNNYDNYVKLPETLKFHYCISKSVKTLNDSSKIIIPNLRLWRQQGAYDNIAFILGFVECEKGKPLYLKIRSSFDATLRVTCGLTYEGVSKCVEFDKKTNFIDGIDFCIIPDDSGIFTLYMSADVYEFDSGEIGFLDVTIEKTFSHCNFIRQRKTDKNEIILCSYDNIIDNYSVEECDYICNSNNSQLFIQSALNDIDSLGYGTIKLLSGEYNIDKFFNYDNSDMPTALLIKENTKLINIVGNLGENGTILNVSSDSSDQVSLFNITQRPLNSIVNNYKNLRIKIADINHKIIAINNFYSGASKIEHIRMYANGYGAGNIPIDGLIGIRCTQGNPNGTGQIMNCIGVTGFYEGFQLGGEHLVATELLARNCYYGYTFGNYNYLVGVMEHPLTLINCCDELSACLPKFVKCGSYSKDNYRGLQQVDLIGFNIELRPLENPTLSDVVLAEETTESSFCGNITFTANKDFHSYENSVNVAFWKDGCGKNFKTVNATHKIGGSTLERLSYTPQYMQEYYDTDLKKKLVYDGDNWVDYNGNTVY